MKWQDGYRYGPTVGCSDRTSLGFQRHAKAIASNERLLFHLNLCTPS